MLIRNINKSLYVILIFSFILTLRKHMFVLITPTHIAISFLLLYYLAIYSFQGFPLVFNKIHKSYYVAVGVLLLALLFPSIYNYYEFAEIYMYTMYTDIFFAMILFVLFSHRKDYHMNFIVLLLISILIMESFLGVLQQLTFSRIGYIPDYIGVINEDTVLSTGRLSIGRVIGFSGHSNKVGARILLIFPFLYFSKEEWPGFRWKLIRYFGMVVSFICLVFTLSRSTGVLFISFFLIIYFFEKMHDFRKIRLFKVKKEKLFFLALSIIIIFSGISATNKYANFSVYELGGKLLYRFQLINQIATNQKYSVNLTSTENRGYMIDVASKAFLDKYLLFGTGYGQSYQIWDSYDYKSIYPSNFPYRPHNAYMIIAVESGIIGLLAYLYIIFGPIIQMLLLKNKNYITKACLCGFTMLALRSLITVHLDTETTCLYFLVYGLALRNISESKEGEKDWNSSAPQIRPLLLKG